MLSHVLLCGEVLLQLDATVLMICHRLQHIRRFDLVVVVKNGRVAEMASPAELLQNSNGLLSQLCRQAQVVP